MMTTAATDAPITKPRRRPVAKSTRGQGETKIKVGLYLSLDAARRLGITSTMESMDRSQIVDELIRNHLRKYTVHVRGDRPGETTESTPLTSAA